jgi:hypothetical protein
MSWAEGSFSDPITILNVYQAYKNLERQDQLNRSGETKGMREKRWAQENFIDLKALKVIIRREGNQNYLFLLLPHSIHTQ